MKEPATVLLDDRCPVEETAWHPRALFRPIWRAIADPMIRQGTLSVFDQVIVSGTNFFTAVIIGRMCSQEQLGVYYLALSVILFARGIQEHVISAPYTVYCHRRRGDALATFAGSSLVHQMVLVALLLVCLLSLAGALSPELGPGRLAQVVWVIMAAGPFLLLREYVRQMAFAHFQMRTAIVVDSVVSAIQIGGLLTLSYFDRLSVLSVFFCIATACAMSCLGWFVAKLRPLRFVPSRIIADWRHNWNFAKWGLASQLVGCTAPYIMPWVLVVAHGEAATGILGACTSLVGLSNMFVMGLSNFLSPKAASAFSKGGVDELRRVLRKTACLFALTLGSFCVIVFFFGDALAVIVYGQNFAGTGAIIAILALGMLSNSFGITAGNGLCAMERPSANFLADSIALVVSIVAITCLVGPFGATGAALASLAGSAAGTTVRTATLARLMKSASLASNAA